MENKIIFAIFLLLLLPSTLAVEKIINLESTNNSLILRWDNNSYSLNKTELFNNTYTLTMNATSDEIKNSSDFKNIISETIAQGDANLQDWISAELMPKTQQLNDCNVSYKGCMNNVKSLNDRFYLYNDTWQRNLKLMNDTYVGTIKNLQNDNIMLVILNGLSIITIIILLILTFGQKIPFIAKKLTRGFEPKK